MWAYKNTARAPPYIENTTYVCQVLCVCADIILIILETNVSYNFDLNKSMS